VIATKHRSLGTVVLPDQDSNLFKAPKPQTNLPKKREQERDREEEEEEETNTAVRDLIPTHQELKQTDLSDRPQKECTKALCSRNKPHTSHMRRGKRQTSQAMYSQI
jgi:hypothetical protein